MSVEIPAGFLSPPLPFRAAETTHRNTSQSSGDKKSADSAGIGKSRPGQAAKGKAQFHRQNPPRSRDGCSTCKQRKVRCDERRPICTPCERLDRKCEWSRVRQFKIVNDSVIRSNRNIHASSSPAWTAKAFIDRPIPSTTISSSSSIPFPALKNRSERDKVALREQPGSYHVICTPETFSRMPSYRSANPVRKVARRDSVKPADAEAMEAHYVIIDDFGPEDEDEIDDEDMLHDDNSSSSASDSDEAVEPINISLQIVDIPTVSRSLAIHRVSDYDSLTRIYDTTTSKIFLPLGSQFSLNLDASGQDVMSSMASEYRPLQHAIHALTTLNIAMKQKPSLLTGAFEHYHQALTFSQAPTYTSPTHALFLHFILLLHDICCANEFSSQGSRMWTLHFDRLAQLLRENAALTQTDSDMRAFVVEYIVYLDAQATLAGVVGAGSCVQAFLEARPGQLGGPTWQPSFSSLAGNTIAGSGQVLRSISRLSGRIAREFASLSQLALHCRASLVVHEMTINSCQTEVASFRYTLSRVWNFEYPGFLPRNPIEAIATLPTLSGILLSFATMQYATAMVYLHTSMFPEQKRIDPTHIADCARYCTIILTMAKGAASRGVFANHHLVFPVFLAGISTGIASERDLARVLLAGFEVTGIGSNARTTRKFFEKVLKEQNDARTSGGSAADVDWIELAREDGLNLINMGL
ncbi:transcription factor-like protein 1 [Elsinoe australis]|uniref:Transcription factor-like protein 1 n=1 Tax=Elsinoe australis TaxID=40998 RepID=A0A4U7B8T0_9PEZI|nr:transcription factor-like protein 1 [Elsinoe australis]